jgi:hypothetical protein
VVIALPAFRQMFQQDLLEAYRQGGRGHAWEDRLLAHPWGFRPRDITPEVHLWQGEADTLVPPTMGRYPATAIPNCAPTFVPGQGHLSLFYHHWRITTGAMPWRRWSPSRHPSPQGC